VRYKVSSLLKKEKGFTLIEIVLVLAIAGLILLMVFLAVSGAQKSRRDTQRKNDLARVAAQVENYASNSAGVYPTAAQFNAALSAGGAYALTNATDPLSGAVYTYGVLVVPAGGTSAGVKYTLGGAGQTNCAGAAMTGTRNFKVQMDLEQGVACEDNS
jgi:prepilin-type N-terminal cleavage/methylation domain-containing protein